MKIAAIDIGSNALRLIIKDSGQPDFMHSLESLRDGEYYERVPLKSGMDVFAAGNILPSTKIKLTLALHHFAAVMQQHGVEQYRAVATSAYRDAHNGQEVISMASRDCGLRVEIIPGEEEARLTRLSFTPQHGWEDDHFLFVDVGGGSTEVSFISNGERLYSHSFNVGTIRLLNNKVKPNVLVEMKQTIGEVTKGYDNIVIIGSGGNINKLYRLANKREKTKEYLPVDVLRRLYERLNKMSVEERMQLFNLKPDRADVIVPAAEIFLHVASSAHVEKIMVPNIGLADGIINDLLRAYVSKKR